MKKFKTLTGVNAEIVPSQWMGNYAPNFNMLKTKGFFHFEGGERNRVVRASTCEPTLIDVIYEQKRRSHNIDCVGNVIWIENNGSQQTSIKFDSDEDAQREFFELTGFKI